MGDSQSSYNRQDAQPEDIGEFRKLAAPEDFYVIPEVSYKRQATDFKFTVTFGACILLLTPFLIYTCVHADVDRFTHGYDRCGNVCGKENSKSSNIDCSGKDETHNPILRYSKTGSGRYEPLVPDECVAECGNDYQEILNRCFPVDNPNEKIDTAKISEIFTDIADDINKSSGTIVALVIIGIGFSIGMLCLFRYFVAYVVWFIIIGSLLGVVAITIIFWYLNSASIAENNPFKVLAICMTVVSLVLVIMLVVMFKRIKLVIRLFKEAIKVIFGIPLILVEPLLTFVATTVLLIILVYFLFVIETAGVLQWVDMDLYKYVPNGVMMFTLFYHVIICIWMAQFIVGCQHMVVSGAVSSYYFSRDKNAVSSPIYNSFFNLIRYHLGTVAIGSLIITIVCVIKALIRSLTNSRQARFLVDCCLGAIEDFLKYLSKNAYILTAMHGQPFFTSGKRAVKLLAANAISAIAVNSVGDFVLAMAKLLIIVCTALVGVAMMDNAIRHFWAAILISVIVTAIVADCLFAVFETAIDTIFLCFCEDSCMNDGITQPYYMTTNLMQYIEDAKKTVKSKD